MAVLTCEGIKIIKVARSQSSTGFKDMLKLGPVEVLALLRMESAVQKAFLRMTSTFGLSAKHRSTFPCILTSIHSLLPFLLFTFPSFTASS